MKTTMCPCKKCLIYPLCKSQVDGYLQSFKIVSQPSKLYLVYREVLMKKCELICKWMDNEFSLNNKKEKKYKFIIQQMKEIFNEGNAMY